MIYSSKWSNVPRRNAPTMRKIMNTISPQLASETPMQHTSHGLRRSLALWGAAVLRSLSMWVVWFRSLSCSPCAYITGSKWWRLWNFGTMVKLLILYMFPRNSQNYSTDTGLSYVVLTAKLWLIDSICIFFANLKNLFSCKRSSILIFAASSKMPTSFHHILSIALPRSYNKMIRANARRVIASVADYLSLRYWSIVKFIRNVMGFYFYSVTISNFSIFISVFSDQSDPEPAMIGFINILPKSFKEWSDKTFPATIFCGLKSASSARCELAIAS